MIYGIAPSAGVFWIDVCQLAFGLIPGSPLGFNTGAAAAPNSLYLGGGGVLAKWKIASPLAPTVVGALPAGTVALSEGPAGFVYAGDNVNGQLHRALPQPLTTLGPFPNGNLYIGDLAYDPNYLPPLVGAVAAPGGPSLVDVVRSTGAQLAPRVTTAPGIGNVNLGGLAYDGRGRLWGEDNGFNLFSVNRPTGALAFRMFISPLIQDLASTPPCSEDIDAELGDAPDNTNHTPSTPMSAYTSVPAAFPTVYDPGTGLPEGPLHWLPLADHWLGASASTEADADLLPDQDGVTNIDPPTDSPDRDGWDDGVLFPIQLPHCQPTTFQSTVTISGPVTTRYANVWLDFNRNGAWGDVLSCVDPTTGLPQTVNEWVAANQAFTLGPGTHLLTTPAFRALDVDDELWMRVGVTEAAAPNADGRGVPGGFEFGETEDYRLVNIADDQYHP